ncbi:MAG TPA: tetratricopeptide repeat protein, partial [Alphaproteobacteria bacterium]|nr:tetratricopeptide repeat protein [Alphaproteobacteria bacterium]
MSGTPAAASPAEDGPERAAGLLCEGVAHEEADRLDAALQAYLAAHRAEPNNAEAIFRAGSAARRLGIVDGAERLLTRSIELAPGSLAPRMELAQLLSDEERYREAERHLLAVAEAAPEAGVAHRLLGLLLHALHRFDEAAAAFERELAVDQENARAWLLLGKALASSTTRFEEAPRAFEKALEHARGALGMLREVALHYFRARDFQTALGYLEQEAALLPAHSSSEPLVHFYLATCLRECGHHERADAELRLALAEVDWQIDTAEPAHAMIYAALKARILHAFGDRDTAIAIHRQVAEMLEPGDFVYPGRCFLPDNDRRIERLRRVVRGRDVAVLLQGPSIAGLEPEMPGLADLDLCYATVNKFPAVEVRLLAPIGRCFDVLMTGNPSDLANFWPQYRDFL